MHICALPLQLRQFVAADLGAASAVREYDWSGRFLCLEPWVYGDTGAAIGIPGGMLLTVADAYKDIINLLRGKHPHGNEPEKNDMIRKGIDYFRNGCMTGFTFSF